MNELPHVTIIFTAQATIDSEVMCPRLALLVLLVTTSTTCRDIYDECHEQPDVFCVGKSTGIYFGSNTPEATSCFNRRDCRLIASARLQRKESTINWNIAVMSSNISYTMSMVITKEPVELPCSSSPIPSARVQLRKDASNVSLEEILITGQGRKINTVVGQTSSNSSFDSQSIFKMLTFQAGGQYEIFTFVSESKITVDKSRKVEFDLVDDEVSVSVIYTQSSETQSILGMIPVKLFDANTVFKLSTNRDIGETVLIGGWILIVFAVLFCVIGLIIMICIRSKSRLRSLSANIILPKTASRGSVWRPPQEAGTLGLFILRQEKQALKKQRKTSPLDLETSPMTVPNETQTPNVMVMSSHML